MKRRRMCNNTLGAPSWALHVSRRSLVLAACCLHLLLVGSSFTRGWFFDGFVISVVPVTDALAFSNKPSPRHQRQTSSSSSSLSLIRREEALRRVAGLVVLGGAWLGGSPSPPVVAAAVEELDSAAAVPSERSQQDPKGVKVYQTPSGLKYIDLPEGRGGDASSSGTPRYGQLLSIAYQAYVTLPGKEPQRYDSVPSYLLKHGNGRLIAGLDEGLHTMSVGMKRRLLIPPKLGYVNPGLGPIPELPWRRDQLNRLLDEMVAVRGGTIVMEVTLLSAMDDEADQGYYEDDSLTPEQFETLKTNLQRKGAEAAARE